MRHELEDSTRDKDFVAINSSGGFYGADLWINVNKNTSCIKSSIEVVIELQMIIIIIIIIYLGVVR